MDQDESINQELDPRYPSGPWTGFFLQYWLPGRHATHMHLDWFAGQLTGAGRDLVGRYTVAGRYDLATGRCQWTKRYVGRHTVEYRGVNDGSGVWGVWEIRQLGGLFTDRGGFHVWPEGSDVSEASDRTEKAVQAMMRQEFGKPLLRVIRCFVFVGAAVALVLLWRWRWHV